MTGNGFPFAPVNDIKGTFAHPQAVARGVTVEVDHPRAGKIKLLAPAVVYNGQKMKVRLFPFDLPEIRAEWLTLGDESAASSRRAYGRGVASRVGIYG